MSSRLSLLFILKEELDKFRLWQQSLGAIPTIAKLQEKAETLRQEEMTKAVKVIIMKYIGYYDIADNINNHDDN